MPDSVLVDTSVWIFALRKQYLPEIRDRVDYLLRENRVVTTGIVKLEILGGTRTENEFTHFRLLFSNPPHVTHVTLIAQTPLRKKNFFLSV